MEGKGKEAKEYNNGGDKMLAVADAVVKFYYTTIWSTCLAFFIIIIWTTHEPTYVEGFKGPRL